MGGSGADLGCVFGWIGGGTKEDFWFGISPEGFGSIAMIFNFIVAYFVMMITPKTPQHIKKIVDNIRVPENE